MKLDEGAVVQKEEIDILAKKERMEFLVETLEEFQFSLKKIAIDEINEIAGLKKKNKKLEKLAEQNYEVKAEKLEKELSQRAKAELEETVSQKDQEIEEKILCLA